LLDKNTKHRKCPTNPLIANLERMQKSRHLLKEYFILSPGINEQEFLRRKKKAIEEIKLALEKQ